MNLTLSRSEKASVCPFEIMRTFVPGEKVRSHAAYAAVVHEKPSCLALSTVTSLLSTMDVASSIKYGHFWNGTAPPDTPEWIWDLSSIFTWSRKPGWFFEGSSLSTGTKFRRANSFSSRRTASFLCASGRATIDPLGYTFKCIVKFLSHGIGNFFLYIVMGHPVKLRVLPLLSRTPFAYVHMVKRGEVGTPAPEAHFFLPPFAGFRLSGFFFP